MVSVACGMTTAIEMTLLSVRLLFWCTTLVVRRQHRGRRFLVVLSSPTSWFDVNAVLFESWCNCRSVVDLVRSPFLVWLCFYKSRNVVREGINALCDKIKLGILNIRRLMKNNRASTGRIEFESHSYGRVTKITEGRNCSQN
ncbi:hypothetical protein DEO72_LG5g1847 [Vigna unguiculata]|uniref:Uncharacterized protein n=1 Tax=Vigna unguiculata TaxID=3917 RepID=A0A4D6LZI9_VIGUN|nr:hypothetical protein DEO72_LG5g1847 [Vigna unguiculata]